MNARRTNQRRSGPRQRKRQNLLEVTVRSRMAASQRNRRIRNLICKLILIVGFLSGGAYGARELVRRYVFENPEYRLAVVEINDESAGVSRETVLGAAALHLGENIFKVRLGKARDAIAALPQVKHVELQRVLPNKITIDIVERRPVAWVADEHCQDASASENSFLIDNKRILFKPKRLLPEYLRLPSVFGVATENFLPGETVDTPEVRAALELIRQNGDAGRFQLESIDLSKGYCMVVTDAKRARITFALDNVERQLERLGAVLDYVDGAHREIQTVNLMVERNVPVTFAPPVGQEPEAAAPVGEKSDKAEESGTAPHPAAKAAATPAKTPVKSSQPAHRAKKPGESPARKPDESSVRRAEPVVRRALPVNPNTPPA